MAVRAVAKRFGGNGGHRQQRLGLGLLGAIARGGAGLGPCSCVAALCYPPPPHAPQARLGITDTTLSRRQLIHQEYEKLCAQLGLPPDAIMDTKEIRRACKNDPEFQRQLEVLAFNLALDPENRCPPSPPLRGQPE